MINLLDQKEPETSEYQRYDLDKINILEQQYFSDFEDRITPDPTLTRMLVSFQANKTQPFYRWYKYKEAFSASLVETLLNKYRIRSGKLLDPFAGVGTALFVASALGLDAHGIELLPIGQHIISTRLFMQRDFTRLDLDRLCYWMQTSPWRNAERTKRLNVLRITDGAYAPETLQAIEQFLSALEQENPCVQSALKLALLSILESISYTRKDGQYLRWDYRSGRKQGAKPFDKGTILTFEKAMNSKLREMVSDLKAVVTKSFLFDLPTLNGDVRLFPGSCLNVLPSLQPEEYEVIVTSPPYCNRYDYTRTYALELALMGATEKDVSLLRQSMLSCTVENRAKDLLAINSQWERPIHVADEEQLLQAIISYLEDQRLKGVLNNNGIPRMVRGYFYEMSCVIHECFRLLKHGGLLLMVNDNVRYAGASIAVDLILSRIAEKLGFLVDRILVLPNGKGNSSQQMGEHGRLELRKCVYAWRKV